MLEQGATLGPYKIGARLGAGGMGDVYAAHDTRLGRTVAIKVLTQRLSQDDSVRKRFLREARAISSLNHPHICALYDIGRENGTEYLVMEYLEGETLAQRLARERLSHDEALRYAIEIAGALERAHRQGIVHRDLKPGNIILTGAGAKLLDFGLARLAASGDESSIGPLTGDDTMLGTIEYMSPEQLKGEAVDARSDIFSFGVMFHEMLAGSRPFEGHNRASLMGAILFTPYVRAHANDIAISETEERLIAACLEKNPDERIQTARDLRRELEWIRDGSSEPLRRRKQKRGFAYTQWVSIIVALVIGAGATAIVMRKPAAPSREVRFEMSAPIGGEQVDWPILSHDGTKLAFIGFGAGGTQSLWVRDLSSTKVRRIPLPPGVMQPAWSPDGRSIAFYVSNKLCTVDLSTNVAQPLMTATSPRGVSWGSGGDILYVPNISTGVWRINALGSAPRAVTNLDDQQQDITHRWPEFLPDGKRFLFVIRSRRLARSGLYLGSLDSNRLKKIATIQSRVVIGRDGHLLYAAKGSLYRQRFDMEREELKDEPVLIAANIGVNLKITGASAISVADNGSFAFARVPEKRTQLVWVDRNGARRGILARADYYVNPALSPDQKRLAVSRIDPDTGRNSIWLINTQSGELSPFVVDDANADGPIWSLSGDSIYYSSDRRGQYEVYEKPVSGIGSDRLVFAPSGLAVMTAVTSSGIFFHNVPASDDAAFWFWPTGARAPHKLVNAIEGTADVTHDGQWMASVRLSAETSAYEVFIQSLLDPSRQRQISLGGGGEPTWRNDGQELYYLHSNRMLMAVPFRGGEPLPAKPLFRINAEVLFYGNRDYVPTHGGERFIVNEPVTADEQSTITVSVPAR